jgi:hypothetical protein
LLRIAFPWRPSYIWRGDPVSIIGAMLPREQAEVLRDFFQSLGVTVRKPTLPTSPKTNGTRSLA